MARFRSHFSKFSTATDRPCRKEPTTRQFVLILLIIFPHRLLYSIYCIFKYSKTMKDRIRSNYLSKLGISPTTTMMHRRRDSDASNASSSDKSVRIDDNATVFEVASFRDLDQSTREDLWYSRKGLKEAAQRNSLDEWQAERCSYFPDSPDQQPQVDPQLASAFIYETYQRESQLYVFQSNKMLAIRNACIRPPVRPHQARMWPQYE